MAFTGYAGPLVIFGKGRPPVSATGLGEALDYNPDEGPSLGAYSFGLMDIRPPFCFQPGQSDTRPFYGFSPGGKIPLIDQVPYTLETNNIAASQTPVAGVPLTLVTTSGAGITVGASVINASTGVNVTGLLAIDGAHGGVPFGQAQSLNIWDPTTALSRTIRIHSVGNDTTAQFLVSGYDIYGYPMTQLVTGGSGADASTLKAFKYIASIVPQGTLSGSAVYVGTNDTWGIPLLTATFGYLDIWWNNTLVTISTGFTGAVVTAPSTNLLGDVRGTYVNQGSASNNTIALQVFWTPSVAKMNLGMVGIYGQPQV